MASLIPDIRDHDGDAASGVRTIPVLLGARRTKTILLTVLLVLGMPLILYSLVALPAFTTLILTGAGLWSLMCVLLLEMPAMIDLLADAISDGQYIAVALGIAILPAILH
jgi:1,4-dihydroxy-2-naphthoate octaprenyltransferase